MLYVGGCSYAGGRLVMSVSEPEDGFMSGSIELALLSESDCETAIGAETTDSTIWGWPWASELRKKKIKKFITSEDDWKNTERCNILATAVLTAAAADEEEQTKSQTTTAEEDREDDKQDDPPGEVAGRAAAT